MLARKVLQLTLGTAALALVACSDDDSGEEAVSELDAEYAGQEIVEELAFASSEHRARHACLIKTSRQQYEALVGVTNVNESDNDVGVVVSWCDLENDSGAVCSRGGGVGGASSPGDVAVQVTANTPAGDGEVADYGYDSNRVQDEANGWRSRVTFLWDSAAPVEDEPEFHVLFSQPVDGDADTDNTLRVSLSPTGFFTSGDLRYQVAARYTLAELVDALEGTEVELQTFFTAHLDAIQNDLEMQAINDVALEESERENYLNELRASFDIRREAVAASGDAWRNLLLEQLEVAACSVPES